MTGLSLDNGAVIIDHRAQEKDEPMTEKQARKFEKLRQGYDEARRVRKSAAKATRAVQGIGGAARLVIALASPAGTKAIEAELAAMKAERRALKKLHAHALKHAGSSEPDEPQSSPASKPLKTSLARSRSTSAVARKSGTARSRSGRDGTDAA
jgi:hypothetical protein